VNMAVLRVVEPHSSLRRLAVGEDDLGTRDQVRAAIVAAGTFLLPHCLPESLDSIKPGMYGQLLYLLHDETSFLSASLNPIS